MKPIYIHSEFITLVQALKMIHVVSSGGEGKHFLLSHRILVDGVLESRRGRKLYPNMTLVIDGGDTYEVLRET